MRSFRFIATLWVVGQALAGCAASHHASTPIDPPGVAASPPGAAEAAGEVATQPKNESVLSRPQGLGDPDTASGTRPVGLEELTRLALERNPRLAQVGWAVETARGRALQAGLYPNPTVNVTGNELGDRTGPSGIWSAYTSQEIVTANKLSLSQAAAEKEVDRATLGLVAERYRLLTEVRKAFFEAATLERRKAILDQLVKLAEQSTQDAEKLVGAKEAARLDVVQLEVDRERYRADLDVTLRAMPAAYRRLAATVGVEDAAISSLASDFERMPPEPDLELARAFVLGAHPEVRSAEIGVERSRLLVRRAEAERIPNVTLGAGYTRQGQNESDDWDIGVSVPIPLWNNHEGSVQAAKAEAGEAVSEVGKVRNELVSRLATAFGTYAAARGRAGRYTTAILPRAEETYRLSRKAYQGGQIEHLRVLAAQRAVAEANLERVRAMGEMWNAASELAGLTLEDDWPFTRTPEGHEP